MRRLFLRGLLAVLVVLALVMSFGPRESVGVLPEPPLAPGATPTETAAQALRAEDYVPGLRPEARKAVVWAGAEDARTPVSVIAVHDFAEDPAWIRPLAAPVAEALGANLFLTRLSGHGAGPSELAQARASDWMLDMAEALAVGRALGDRVLVIGAGLGGALAAIAAAEPGGQERIAGYAFVSPTFELRLPGAHLLAGAFGRQIAVLWGGEHEGAPAEALAPLAAVAEAASLTLYEGVTAPALFLVSDDDATADPAAAREVAGRWGTAAQVVTLAPGPRDDPTGHALAGPASPELTEAAVAAVLDWARARGIGETPPR